MNYLRPITIMSSALSGISYSGFLKNEFHLLWMYYDCSEDAYAYFKEHARNIYAFNYDFYTYLSNCKFTEVALTVFNY